jgi:TorA maturation chaperone TorD
MTNQERAFFSKIMSSLFAPPDHEMMEQVAQGKLYSYLRNTISSWGGDMERLRGFHTKASPEILLMNLKEEYDRLFSDTGAERISLVESFYKPWTRDPHCTLPFATDKGFLMGDSAIHLSMIYGECGLEPEPTFKGMPDHLVIELEFLSYLYQGGDNKVIRTFIENHLDWIPLLKKELDRSHPHPFYVSASEILDLFLKKEVERLEGEA